MKRITITGPGGRFRFTPEYLAQQGGPIEGVPADEVPPFKPGDVVKFAEMARGERFTVEAVYRATPQGWAVKVTSSAAAWPASMFTLAEVSS